MTTRTSPAPGDPASIPPARSEAEARDAANPLRDRRELFTLPPGMVYLDGNSLGALPLSVQRRMQHVVTDEWGAGLIASWNAASWIDLPRRVGARIAALLSLPPDSVWVSDSTSVSLFKTMVAGCRLRPGRDVLVVERSTFPTDGYVAASVARMLGMELRWADPQRVEDCLDERVAVVCLTHVDFRTGALFDVGAQTAAAHGVGALMLWDLCHTAGAVPVDLVSADADMAVGCSYKYLHAGPGSPAFMYVAPRHLDALDQPLSGWMAHARPFGMENEFEPVQGIGRLASGTPPILALSALDAALDAFDGVDPADLRATSLSLTGYFMDLVDQRLPGVFEMLTPRQPERRGSQVSLRHPDAYGLVQALIDRRVVGDFRAPDIARFGFDPLYVTHTDVYDAVEHLVAVLAGEEHLRPAYSVRNRVT